MVIGQSSISMDSSRSFFSESLTKSTTTIGNQTQVAVSSQRVKSDEVYFKDIMKSEMTDDVTEEMEKSMLGMRSKSSSLSGRINNVSRETSKTVREQTLIFLLRILYNRIMKKKDNNNQFSDMLHSIENKMEPEPEKNIIGYSQNYYSYEESEETTFSSKGMVKTKDGREISFNVDMIMSRSFKEEYFSENEIEAIKTTNLYDPLVINLDDNPAEISDQKFYFDIDSDGIKENISSLGKSTGFIALDLNNDGIINNGSELFGTKSGNGLVDLSKYDEDGNGWIDENDSIFSKLLIWTKDENGNDMLYHLKEKGVGAIYLEGVKTNFSMNSVKDNATNAVVRRTGIFLYENGNVGTIQQIDLAT